MLKFTETNEWLKIRGRCRDRRDHRTTPRAAGDLCFGNCGSRSPKLDKAARASTVESVKAASDVYLPAST